jgi:hypothetical protein
MRKFSAGMAVVAVLAFAGGASAAGRWVVSNINQIKPSVRQQLRGQTGSEGPQGPQGPQGVQGPAAPAGVGQTQLVGSPQVTLQPGQNTYQVDPSGFEANCPGGYTATGTGFNGGGVASVEYVESYGFFVGGFLVNNSSIPVTVQIFAVCAPGSSGLAPAIRGTGRPEDQYRAQLQDLAAKAR